MNIKKIYVSILAMSIILLASIPAFAHRVNLFAYVEGDIVYTESYFSKKRKVHQGKLQVFSTKTGKEILKGITDNNGNFNFPIPDAIKTDRSGLLINLYASEGHRAVWTLSADEIFPETESTAAAQTQTSTLPETEKPVSIAPTEHTSYSGSEIAELSAQVKNLTDKVETLKRLIISQQEKGPGVNEIFSGIGYILGLFGVAAFFLSRKK